MKCFIFIIFYPLSTFILINGYVIFDSAQQLCKATSTSMCIFKNWLISIMAIAIKKKLKAGISEFCSSHPT